MDIKMPHNIILSKKRPKRGNVLWHAVRRSMPVFVGRPPKNRFRKPHTPFYMFDPDTRGKRTWDTLLTLAVIYTACVVPYRVCFDRDAVGKWALFENALDVAFFTDILLNFVTGLHLPNGDVSYVLSEIARAYLRGWFLIDFFSTVPFDELSVWFGAAVEDSAAMLGTKLLRGLRIVRLFKLARVRRINKMFSNLEDGIYTNQSLLSLSKLALTMLFIAHLVACVWFAVGQLETTSWISTIHLDTHSDDADEALLQYLASVYWAIVTMATIGYGDVVAENNSERVLNIAIMAIGVSFFGYVIGTISTLVSNLDVAAAMHEEQMTIVKEYIISRAIPKQFSRRIRDHFEYYYQNRSVFKEKKILKRLPSALRNEMIHHVHSKLVTSIKYFTKCHESLISDIVMVMRPFSVHKDEYIYVQHEIAAHVFFLLKGKVHLTKTVPTSKAEIRLATLTVGEHFGELEVYDHEHGNGVRICSAIAKSYCELTFLSRHAISKISASWPEIARHFKEAATTASKRMRRRADANQDSDHDDNAFFRDDMMEQTFLKSSELVTKTMRATGRKERRSNRISPFEGGSELDSVRERRFPHEHGPSIQAGQATEQSQPTESDSSNNIEALNGRGEALLADTTELTGFDTPLSPTKKSSRRIILESLSPEQARKVRPVEEKGFVPSGKPQRYAVTDETAESSDDEDTSPKRTYSPGGRRNRLRERDTPSAVQEEEHDHGERENDATITTNDPDESEIPAPDESAPVPNPAPSQSQVQQAKLENQESLHALIAKIRDTPPARPKSNLHSERVMLKGTYVFHPQEPFILTWQFVIGLGILYSIVVVPYRLGFDADALETWYILEMVIDSFFVVDMLFNFRTAFFDDERTLIFDTKIIFWRYAKGWFVLDLLSTIPIDEIARILIGDSTHQLNFLPTKLLRLFRIARLLKLARLIKLSRVAGKLREFIEISPSVERLVKLLLVMSLFCHWNACSFHAVLLASESSGYPGWCSEFFPDTSNPPSELLCTERVDLMDRYIISMYWAFTTFTTVGYGDIKPNLYSPYELALVIFLIVINATAFGYILSSVITLIRNLDPSDREYRLRMTEMKDYLRDACVSNRLCSNVKAHYEHNIMSTSLFPEEKLFDKMSPSLRFDVARLVAGETLFAIPLITVMEDSFKGFVSYALFLFQPLCIMRGEKVCQSGGPGCEMFFLVEGECDLVNSQTGEGRVIAENAVFEQYALMAQPDEIYRTVSTVTALSKKCILYSLAIQDYRMLGDVSPAVSTYFLCQLAAVLVEDDLFTLSPTQKANVERALRNGRAFRATAELHNKPRLSSVGNVAMAAKQVVNPRRRGSEWTPDILPRLLTQFEQATTPTLPPANELEDLDTVGHPNEIPES